ncbi:hypothetical protein QA641_38055 [Bradyrhizobium sp. CB1650]|uniref:hypothetical protein n=1 Tax=Bradyrhizobium sp. CB1650 TaxID=3039153 RepID=UPI0024356098|nr:hypothetical protein [Bradyrhizobium sp. CB1650]WGD51232.1 hypothetical protein QA641_38055 [Bradyrhizobium sp. CB1650]
MAGLGDTVAKRNTRVNVESLDKILDKSVLRVRAEEIAAATLQDDKSARVREFLAAWKRQEESLRRY